MQLTLTVQAYASSYAGHARVARLLFIASKTAGTQMELEALRLAADQLRKVGILLMSVTELLQQHLVLKYAGVLSDFFLGR